MGELSELVKLSLLVNGNGIEENYKNNSLYFYNKYSGSDSDVVNIPVAKVTTGSFYFFHYMDSSNWMKWSPVFVTDYKKFSNKIIIFAVNFNFIPMEVRVMIFDKYITSKDFESDSSLKVDHNGMYSELRSLGFEYALMEYDASLLHIVHRININLVPRFFYAGHPKNIYDPQKLMQIWEAKLSKRDQRHQEMMIAIISDFYDMNNEISGKYNVLKGHIQRIQNNISKYGNR